MLLYKVWHILWHVCEPCDTGLNLVIQATRTLRRARLCDSVCDIIITKVLCNFYIRFNQICQEDSIEGNSGHNGTPLKEIPMVRLPWQHQHLGNTST